jgi:GMP synthase PP-ATPase subunit
VTAERLSILRAADAIAREELTAAGLDREIWQCPVVLLATCGPLACKAMAAATVTRSCCARSPPRTR